MKKSLLTIIGITTAAVLVVLSVKVIANAATYAPGPVMALAPSRIMDTRSNLGAPGPVASVGTISLQVAGKGGVPATGASAVFLNITVTGTQGAGYVTAWPSGVNRSETSNINFTAGQTIANSALVPIGSDGKIQFFNGAGGNTQIIADVTGYVSF